MIIGICLTIMLFITLFSVVLGTDFLAHTVEGSIDNSLIVNGSTTDLGITYSAEFAIDPVLGAIAIIVTIGVIASLVGINVVGTGLSDESVRLIMISFAYVGVWGVLSILAFPLISSIEVFGSLIYVTLTIVYVVGVIQRAFGGRD